MIARVKITDAGRRLFGVAVAVPQAIPADDLVAQDDEAYFVLGWSAGADALCGLNTYRILLATLKSRGLTDSDVARNVPKIASAIVQAREDMSRIGRMQFCSDYQRGFLTGK